MASVEPAVEQGRFPVKRVTGEELRVTAQAVCDGHDVLRCTLLYRAAGTTDWTETFMEAVDQDRWTGSIVAGDPGRYEYAVTAWVDRFATWQRDLVRRSAGDAEIAQELEVGARLAEEAAATAPEPSPAALQGFAASLRSRRKLDTRLTEAANPAIAAEMRVAGPRWFATVTAPLPLVVEPAYARSGAWYEFFPRSTGSGGRHGTFATAGRMLEYAAAMGFDVVYLPPIHPIGEVNRKGRNNATRAEPGDPGSPWAIGSAAGGHEAIHPELGTLDDFERFVARARDLDLRLALDLAFQCAPDHPWVGEHPQWFRQRPDGSIRHAENPPKKYEDIVPLDFETEDWEALWEALLEVVLTWVDRGIVIFRVDNPHTKPLPFWEWLIAAVKERHPDVVFLAEAFTRPALLEGLAKRGFSQSYTYFAWRNTRHEIEQYFNELINTDRVEYLRPNLWPNTPDILTEYLQTGGRAAFAVRAALAATLGASYGVYGPPFESCEAEPREPGSEEYLDSEKYQLRSWDLDRDWSLRDLLGRINAIRREHPALLQDRTLRFHESDNPQVICYSKTAGDDVIVVVANLDPHFTHRAHVTLDTDAVGIDADRPYQVHDLLGAGRYLWTGNTNFVELNPGQAHIFAPRRKLRTERDFDYYQ